MLLPHEQEGVGEADDEHAGGEDADHVADRPREQFGAGAGGDDVADEQHRRDVEPERDEQKRRQVVETRLRGDERPAEEERRQHEQDEPPARRRHRPTPPSERPNAE